MHSSRMRTARLLTVWGGVCPTQGVCIQEGLANPKGVCPTPGVCIQGGLPNLEGLHTGGVCPTPGGLHPGGLDRPPFPCEQNDTQV